MMTVFSHRLVLVFTIGLGMLVGGCRTYGGYDTEPNTLEQIQESVDALADAYDRAQANLELLQEVASGNPAYEDAVARYVEAVEAHEATLSYARDLAEEAAEDEDDYRVLSRTYGALVTEQYLVRDRYDRIVNGLQNVLESPDALPGGEVLVQQWVRTVPLNSRYQVRPPYYERVDYAQRPPTTLRDLVGTGSDTQVLTMPEPPLEDRVDTDLSE
jgi:hypothetical protein